ncbi:metallophosphoesterase family protein [Sphingomonas aracearum]|uniref:Serine/threonine protein phosphatase n=1 Tax=Sphingomonas aracearum TaxID=2283317 RepID=A0A369VWV7_9SPHN|nr:metallophosphoesterase family protein [Sphingomonas aracearum]RDE05562.1 serine/threonine protein phosphatase [Sphingomonas aracearum]
MISRIFRSRTAKTAALPAVPPGQRLYAVGDVHGRLDLLEPLLARIEDDDAGRAPASTTLVFLGDLVDRGPQSAQVIDRLIALKAQAPQTRFLMGNHEEVMLLSLDADREALRLFARIGGRETILSYGVDRADYDAADYDGLFELMRAHVPEAHRAFLRAMEDMVIVGDYAFVHAGVRPDVPLAEQKTGDLRWIRGRFLDHGERLEKMIVHGHSIADDVQQMPHRIGLDTGAFSTDRLSAMGFESTQRWVLQT